MMIEKHHYGDAVPGIRDSRGACKECNTHNEVHAPNCQYHPDRVMIDGLNKRIKELEEENKDLRVAFYDGDSGAARRIKELEEQLAKYSGLEKAARRAEYWMRCHDNQTNELHALEEELAALSDKSEV